MTIETKYDLNELVWIMYANKIREAEITGYRFQKSNSLCSWNNIEEYCVNLLPDVQMHIVTEKDLFKTKEELIQSL